MAKRQKKATPPWRHYQIKAARLFRKLGCSAQVDAEVRGVRAKHGIDVWVEFKKYGLPFKIAIECKYWSKRVPKRCVAELKSIAEDVGASFGIIMTEQGFQRGALQMASRSNVLLYSLQELQTSMLPDLEKIALEKIEVVMEDLLTRGHQLWKTEKVESGHYVGTLRPGVNDGLQAMERLGQAAILAEGIKRARLGNFPAMYGWGADKETLLLAQELSEFLEQAAGKVEEIRAWLEKTEQQMKEECKKKLVPC